MIDGHDAQANQEAVQYFMNAKEILNDIDYSLKILPWRYDHHPSLQASDKVTNKMQLAKYVERIFVQHGRNPWIRVKVSHDVHKEELISHAAQDQFSAGDIVCYLDPIQDTDTACLGWLLGAPPKSFNTQEYTTALKAHLLIANRDIEIRIQDYKKTS